MNTTDKQSNDDEKYDGHPLPDEPAGDDNASPRVDVTDPVGAAEDALESKTD